jgi:GntR family transcriptional regulator, transcriptional repressor for pyruvate dehydrogenase complex
MSKSVVLDVAPVQTERAYQAVARAIEAKILGGEWTLGSALPGEFALADAFGVHRSTMREAIRVLEQEGLLERRKGGKQLLVNAPAGSHVASRMTAAIVLQEVTFRELWETMLVLEPAAAEAAASRATEEDLQALDANLEASRRALSDARELVVLDMAFLDIIASASRNRALQLCRSPIGQLLYPAFLPVMQRPPAGARLLVAHEAIMKALNDRDPVAASSWMHRHVVDFRRGYEAAGLDIEGPVAWPTGRLSATQLQDASI